jgi:tetratricopeptide (TPR) repeat protein
MPPVTVHKSMARSLLLLPLLLLLLQAAHCLPPSAVQDSDTAEASYALGERLLARAHAGGMLAGMPAASNSGSSSSGSSSSSSGSNSGATGDADSRAGDYEKAADYFFAAMLRRQPGASFEIEGVFMKLALCYRGVGKPEGLYLRIGQGYIKQGDLLLARQMGASALEINPASAPAHLLLAASYAADQGDKYSSEGDTQARLGHLQTAEQLAPRDWEVTSQIGNVLWEMRKYAPAAAYFTRSYQLNASFIEARAYAIYTRSSICDWGRGGAQYDEDMRTLVLLMRYEERVAENATKAAIARARGSGDNDTDISNSDSSTTSTTTSSTSTTNSTRSSSSSSSSSSSGSKDRYYPPAVQASVVQPHMALGFDIPADLKLQAARSHARYLCWYMCWYMLVYCGICWYMCWYIGIYVGIYVGILWYMLVYIVVYVGICWYMCWYM